MGSEIIGVGYQGSYWGIRDHRGGISGIIGVGYQGS